MVKHPIDPVYDENSRILILGSFPSVKSREQMFFYGHPQNRFWRVMAAVLEERVPETVEEKRAMLISHGVAVWDVIASCEIEGSSDSSIKGAVPNDIGIILGKAKIESVYVNGMTAKKYFDKYLKKLHGCEAIALPSTSPANAVWSIARLIDAWSVIKKDL